MNKLSRTPFALGASLNNPDLWEPAYQAMFQTNYNSFTALMGVAPQFIGGAVDYAAPVSGWIGSASGQAQSNAASVDAKPMIPVMGLPLASIQFGSMTPDQQFQAFASGQYDSVITGIVGAWAQQGYFTQIYRLGWEMNLLGPTYAGSDAQSQADWVKAFQHVYTVLHQAATADGVNLQVMWNPGVTNYSLASATTSLYPGSNYVDMIGIDIYSDIVPYSDSNNPPTYHDWATGGEDTSIAQFLANPINREHYWNHPAANQWSLDASAGHALSFDQLLQFALQQGKPFAIPETGAGNSNSNADIIDDPLFPQWLSAKLTAAQASGLNIAFVSPFNTNSGGNYEFSNASDNKPLQAAAWAKYFGAQTPVTPPTAVGGQVLLSGIGEAGVTVSLLNASGAAVATTTTNSTGAFILTAPAAGRYQVKYTAPNGQVLQTGSGADAATGLTPVITLASGQTLNLPAEQLLPNTGSTWSSVFLLGGPAAPAWGVSDPGVGVSLLDASGRVVATATTDVYGWFKFSNLAAGIYQLRYTPPAGQAIAPSGLVNSTTGLTAQFAIAAGQNVTAPSGSMISGLTMNGSGVRMVKGDGNYIITGSASQSTLTLGAGDQNVTLIGNNDTVVTGAGNQTIRLTGSGNTITVGKGNSLIINSGDHAVAHVAGGNGTIFAGGAGNQFDSGPGLSFLVSDGSASNKFVLNAGGTQGLSTIAGFNFSDVLDVHRTLAGMGISPNLSNVSSYITSAVSGGNTTLYLAPAAGHGTQAFAVLSGFQTSVSQLQNAHVFALS